VAAALFGGLDPFVGPRLSVDHLDDAWPGAKRDRSVLRDIHIPRLPECPRLLLPRNGSDTRDHPSTLPTRREGHDLLADEHVEPTDTSPEERVDGLLHMGTARIDAVEEQALRVPDQIAVKVRSPRHVPVAVRVATRLCVHDPSLVRVGCEDAWAPPDDSHWLIEVDQVDARRTDGTGTASRTRQEARRAEHCDLAGECHPSILRADGCALTSRAARVSSAPS